MHVNYSELNSYHVRFYYKSSVYIAQLPLPLQQLRQPRVQQQPPVRLLAQARRQLAPHQSPKATVLP